MLWFLPRDKPSLMKKAIDRSSLLDIQSFHFLDEQKAGNIEVTVFT